MIAVCDHNSARNVAAVQEAAGTRLAVLAGMEITTAEECHVVGLFPDAAAAEAAGAEVGATLGPIDDGYEAFFGEQRLLDAAGRETGRERLALATATALDVDRVVELVHRHGGLAVAAHIDRRSFGAIGQLGFFPAGAGFDAVAALPPRARRVRARSRVRRARPADPALVRRALPRRRGRRAAPPSPASGRASTSWRWPSTAATDGASAMHDLSLYLLDILENSVRAGATVIATAIVADRERDEASILVEDDGPGLPVEPEQALDPFFTTKANKKTGLGLSLFRQAAEAAGGGLSVGRSGELRRRLRARLDAPRRRRPPALGRRRRLGRHDRLSEAYVWCSRALPAARLMRSWISRLRW